jgi:large repetitive protein
MSEVKVNKISPRTGTTFTIGDSGDTISTAATISGATIGAGTINATAININGTPVNVSNPTITSISPDTITNTQTAITITGANYISIPTVDAILTTGAIVPADTVTFNNSTSLTCNFTLPTDGTYYIRIENNDGLAVRSSTALLTVSDAPVWTTASGTLGTIAGDFSGTVATVAATGDSTLAYSETTNVLTNAAQANCSLNSATGVITTTDFGGSGTTATTYTFTLRVTDAEGQTADRAFTLTSSYNATGGGQFN